MAGGGVISRMRVFLGLDNKNFKKGLSESENKTKSFGKTVGKIGGLIAGAFAVSKITSFFKTSFKLYGIQEMAERKLGAQIQANGKAATSTLSDYKRFASEIQNLTTVGDEATLGMLQVAESMGATTKQSKEAVKGAIGLSKAFGISMETALRGVILAQQGEFEMLNRYIPALRSANTDVEKAAVLQKSMADGFIIATAEAETSAGKLEQLGNSWGDLMEKIGGSVANSPQLEFVLTTLKGIVGLGNDLENTQEKVNKGALNIFQAWSKEGKLSEEFLIERIKLLGEENKKIRANGGITKDGAVERIKGNNALKKLLKEQLELGDKKIVAKKIEVRNEAFLSDEIKKYEEKSKTATGSIRADINDRITALNKEIDVLKKLSNIRSESIDKSQTETGITATSISDVTVSGQSVDDGRMTNKGTMGAGIETEQEAKRQEELAKQQAFVNDMNNITAGGMATLAEFTGEFIGAAISGDAGLEDYFAGILSTVGDFIKQYGEALIAYGIAEAAFKKADPATKIAAGIALVALGSVISSLAAAGPGGSSSSGNATSIDTRNSDTRSRNATVNSNAQTVNVNVTGTIKGKDIALANNQGQKDLRR